MTAAMRRSRLVLGVIAMLMLLSIWSASGLGVDTDSSRMLDPQLPAQTRAHQLNAAFPGIKRTIVITIGAPSADQADALATQLVSRIEEHLAVDNVFAPSVDPYLSAHGFLYQGIGDVDAMFAQLSKSANLLAQLRVNQSPEGFFSAVADATRLAAGAGSETGSLDPLYAETARVLESVRAGGDTAFEWSGMLGPSSTGEPLLRVISVQPVLDTTRLNPAKPALTAIEAAIAALPSDLMRGAQIGVTGEPALRAEEMQSVLSRLGLSLGLSLILVVVILRIGLRSFPRAGAGFAALLVTLVLTTGFAAAAVGTLNLISIAFIVLMVGLGIDFAIHVLAHLEEDYVRTGSVPEAVEITGLSAGLALTLSAITTSLAFLAFATTDFAGMAQLGLIGGAGVLIAFAVAITLLPALAAHFPRIASAPSSSPKKPPDHPTVRRWPALVAVLLGCAALWPAAQARFDADPMALRNPSAPAAQAFANLASTPQTSPYRASVLVGSAEEAAHVKAALADVDEVARVTVLADLIPDEQYDKLDLLDLAAPSIEHAVAGDPVSLADEDDAPPIDRLLAILPASSAADALRAALETYDPSDAEALSDALFRFFPLLTGRLEALLSADIVTAETLPPPMAARFLSADGLQRVEVVPARDLRDPNALEAFDRAVRAAAPEAAGGPVQLAAAGRSVGGAMLTATLLAIGSTLLLVGVSTRSLAATVAVLAPLILAGILTAAMSHLLDQPFNYANVIVLPLMIGIGVDSGIHLAMRATRSAQAVFATSTPRAVFYSALTTFAAFGTLGLSEHRGTASMGILLAVAMVAAVLSVFALTPALIRALGSR